MKHNVKSMLALLVGLVMSAPLYAQTWLVKEGALQLDQTELENMMRYTVPEEERERWKRDRIRFNDLVSDYFMLKQLEQEALKQGIDQEPEIVSKLQLQRLRALSSIAMQRQLDAMPEPNFEKAAREHYQVERSKYQSPEQVHARHILIALTDERDDEAAHTLALELREKLLAKPEGFTELAQQYSDDPSAKSNGGDLGFFAATQMVKPFADAAFALKVNEISNPVRSQFGYHVIQVLAKQPSKQLIFEEVKNQLVEQERVDFKRYQHEELRQSIQQRKGVEYNTQALEALYQNIVNGK